MLGWDNLVYKKGGYEGYLPALGTDKIEYIVVEGTDDFEKTQFDVKIEAVIDDTAQLVLQERINIALNNKEITLEDALQVEQVAKTNVTYAAYILAARQRKRDKQRRAEALENSRANTEAAVAAAKAKSEGEIELERVKSQLSSQAKKEELQMLEASEIIKFNSIAKVEIIKNTLSKEGGTLEQVPSWVFQGIPEIQAVQEQLMAQQSQDLEREQMEEQQQLMQEDEISQFEFQPQEQ